LPHRLGNNACNRGAVSAAPSDLLALVMGHVSSVTE
jgi:hypothetical protein